MFAPDAISFSAKRFSLLFLLAGVIWALLLRFHLPGYLDPFVPYHSDHYIYLGDSAEPYTLARYILHYPRPLGNALFDLLGRLGIRGMLVPVFIVVLANVCLLVSYVERLSEQLTSLLTLAVFFVLLFGNPESYSSTKEDILASVSFFCLLIIFHLWQNFLNSGRLINLAFIVLLALISSYIKETYFATSVAFFAMQVLINTGRFRKSATWMAIACLTIAAVSLAYNAHISIFVNLHSAKTGPYYQDRSLPSIMHGYRVLLKPLLRPIPAILVAAALVLLFRNDRRRFWIGLVALLLAGTNLLPHSILPNHLEDQYAWLAAGFFFVPLLLADGFLPKTRNAVLFTALGALLVCGLALRDYRRHMAGRAVWVIRQERYQRNILAAWPTIKQTVRNGEHELVIGPRSTFSPFDVESFVLKSFGPGTQWTVVVPDEIPTDKVYTTTLIHRDQLKPEAYDHGFVFSPDDRLLTVYSKDQLAALIARGQWQSLIPAGDYSKLP